MATRPSISAATPIRMEAAEVTPGAARCAFWLPSAQVTRLGESVFRNGAISARGHGPHLRGAGAHGGAVPQAGRGRGAGGGDQRPCATRATRRSFWRARRRPLGTPVEIISGAGRSAADSPGRAEPVAAPGQARPDRSTSAAAARRSSPASGGALRDAVSKPLGAVRLREMFLGDDPPAERDLHRMHEYVEERLAGLAQRFGGAAGIAPSPPPPRRRRWSARSTGCRAPGATQADRMRASAAQVRRCSASWPDWTWRGGARSPASGPAARRSSCRASACLLQILEDLPPALGLLLRWRACGTASSPTWRRAAWASELSRLSREQRREVEQMSRKYGVSPGHARKVAEMARTLFSGSAAAAQPPPELRQAAGSRGVPARRGALRQRFQPPQAFLLPGGQFRPAGFHQPGAGTDRQPVPLPPQGAAGRHSYVFPEPAGRGQKGTNVAGAGAPAGG